MSHLRRAAVAGTFYPASASELGAEVDAMLAAASARDDGPRVPPKAVIAPHAGYVYSGPVAASVFARLGALRGRVRRVVLLGPAHRVAIRGAALPEASAFETPLGVVAIDEGAIAAIPGVPRRDDVHRREHALEVELPFLLRVLGDFALVPLAIGAASDEAIAAILEALWGGPETLIVVSSDLSHYLPYEVARAKDAETARRILALAPLDHDDACGATPVGGLLEVARRRGLRPELVDLRSSGDTAGGRDQVVGYGAFAFHEGGAGAG